MVTLKTVCGTMIALAFFSLSAFNCPANETDYIDTSAYTEPTQPKVAFMHDSHNEKAELEECSRCHHQYEDGVLIEAESSEDMPCSACHSPKMFNTEMTLTSAFHKNCKGCHINKKKGPIMCGECHKRQ